MARDRQRAKQRRRRNTGAGGSASGPPRSRARDERERDKAEPEATGAPEPTEPDPTGAPEPTEHDLTGAPEPTEHAFPDVEQARMAEAGVPQHADFEEDDVDDMERAPDELQAGGAYAEDPAVTEERAERRSRRKRGKIITFLGHVIDELRRVQWPDRRQTGQGTAVTLGFVVIAGGFLGLMDAIWRPLVEAIL